MYVTDFKFPDAETLNSGKFLINLVAFASTFLILHKAYTGRFGYS